MLAGPAYAGRQLLLLDRAGTGRVVEAFGDLSRAHRIAVLVPGVDNRLADFDRGLGGVQRRAPAWQARQLRASVGSDVAVVAWLGYLPPAGIDLDAVRSERAQRGADELVAFVRGLAVQAPQATAVVVGHSYGSLVAGYAARRLPADVTDLVEIGSPGPGRRALPRPAGTGAGVGRLVAVRLGPAGCPTSGSSGWATVPSRTNRSSGLGRWTWQTRTGTTGTTCPGRRRSTAIARVVTGA